MVQQGTTPSCICYVSLVKCVYCGIQTSDWYDLWLNIEQMVTLMVECWADNVALVYHPDSHTTTNVPGVETRIPGFGDTQTVEFIDKSMRGFSTYFSLIVSKLVKQVEYLQINPSV